MDNTRELRKFPRGERCPECGVRRWYLENGLRFCSNGHQVEGFVQFDVGDIEDSGKLGATARREKEVKKQELRHLSGQAGKNLYMECLQLILRDQLLWLIGEKGFREELETVVRDLWDLRIRGSSAIAADDDAPDGELEMFSSQVEQKEEADAVNTPKLRGESWDSERGPDWPMPKVIDTLVLCYMGCLLLRIPTRVGEICQWVNGSHMPYKRAYYDLPQEMQDRLPSAYTRALKLPLRSPVKAIDLHNAILSLALSYKLNYNMQLPSIAETPILVQYARNLALPVEVPIVAKKIMDAMNISFVIPTERPRVFAVDHPEILLLAISIVAAKLCYPFEGHQPLLGEVSRVFSTFSWTKWRKGVSSLLETTQSTKDQRNFDKVTVDDVTTMTPQELDAYFAHIASLIDKRNENPVVGFFPTENAPDFQPPHHERAEAEMDHKVEEVLRRATGFLEEEDSTNFPPPGHKITSYDAFRTVEDLSVAAEGLYTAASNISGISLQEAVRAVYMFEQRILSWQRDKRPGVEGDDENRDDQRENVELVEVP